MVSFEPQIDWDIPVHHVEYAYNNSVRAATSLFVIKFLFDAYRTFLLPFRIVLTVTLINTTPTSTSNEPHLGTRIAS